jgi:Tol biopolymer transport system component
MKRILSPPLSLVLVLLVLSCGIDATGPIDEHSLVLAYGRQSGQRCSIVLSSLTGQTRRIQNVCAYGLAWSPDGARLAFNKGGGEAAPPTLWMVNADGSGESEVVGGQTLSDPDWSPDGTRIAAVRTGAGTIVIIHSDGTGRTELTGAGVLSFDRVSWSPDGTEILFARSDTLWAVSVSTDVVRVVAVPGLEEMYGARWSPDGSRISVDARSPAGIGVYVMNADGTHQQLLAEAFAISPAPWSPDGTQLVYGAISDTTVDVFVASSDGGTAPRNLTKYHRSFVSSWPDWARRR